MIALSLFIKNIFGWIVAHWRPVAAGVAGVCILILCIFAFRSCGKKEAKIDHETVQKVNSQNKAEARKEVREMVEENLDVIETVNDRTALSEVNAVERDRKIEEKIAEVNQKIEEAKAIKGNVTQEDLQCILVPSDCQ